MANTKTGLLYSELTGHVYWGTMNADTGIARGNKKDVTSDFIGIMLQKFPPNFKQNIVCNGKFEAEIIVLGEDNKNRARFEVAKEMEDMLAEVLHNMEVGNSEHTEINDAMIPRISALLAKARGEA